MSTKDLARINEEIENLQKRKKFMEQKIKLDQQKAERKKIIQDQTDIKKTLRYSSCKQEVDFTAHREVFKSTCFRGHSCPKRCDQSYFLHCFKCHANRVKDDYYGKEDNVFQKIGNVFYCYDCLSDPKVAKQLLANINQKTPRSE